jgi:hypothetical protein
MTAPAREQAAVPERTLPTSPYPMFHLGKRQWGIVHKHAGPDRAWIRFADGTDHFAATEMLVSEAPLAPEREGGGLELRDWHLYAGREVTVVECREERCQMEAGERVRVIEWPEGYTPPTPPVAPVYEDGWVYFEDGPDKWRTNEFCQSERWYPSSPVWGFAGLYSARDIAKKGWKQVYPKPADQAEGAVREWDEADLAELFDEALNARPHLLFDFGYNRQVDWLVAIHDASGVGIKDAALLFSCQHHDREESVKEACEWLWSYLGKPVREVAGAGAAEFRYFIDTKNPDAFWRLSPDGKWEKRRYNGSWDHHPNLTEVTATGTPLA